MNTFWSAITSNYIINVGVTSWFSAQLIKTVLTFLQYRELRAERLFGAGGMPSSHSALVCSMTVGMAKLVGFDSPLFGLTFAFAMVVMYDATRGSRPRCSIESSSAGCSTCLTKRLTKTSARGKGRSGRMALRTRRN